MPSSLIRMKPVASKVSNRVPPGASCRSTSNTKVRPFSSISMITKPFIVKNASAGSLPGAPMLRSPFTYRLKESGRMNTSTASPSKYSRVTFCSADVVLICRKTVAFTSRP